MSPGARAREEAALLPARLAAYQPGEYVGQESFMRASEIRELAGRADIGATTSVLDLCCGVGGPGLLVAEALGCDYLGVDRCPEAVDIARRRAVPGCRFEVRQVPPLPPGQFDVVLLLETVLAFRDKPALFGAVASALAPGGRFAFTVEEGPALTTAERALMPGSDTVWPVPLADLVDGLRAVGLQISWQADHTAAHLGVASSLGRELGDRADGLRDLLGSPAVDHLLGTHRVWARWLGSGRVRKLAVVATRQDLGTPTVRT